MGYMNSYSYALLDISRKGTLLFWGPPSSRNFSQLGMKRDEPRLVGVVQELHEVPFL